MDIGAGMTTSRLSQPICRTGTIPRNRICSSESSGSRSRPSLPSLAGRCMAIGGKPPGLYQDPISDPSGKVEVGVPLAGAFYRTNPRDRPRSTAQRCDRVDSRPSLPRRPVSAWLSAGRPPCPEQAPVPGPSGKAVVGVRFAGACDRTNPRDRPRSTAQRCDRIHSRPSLARRPVSAWLSAGRHALPGIRSGARPRARRWCGCGPSAPVTERTREQCLASALGQLGAVARCPGARRATGFQTRRARPPPSDPRPAVRRRDSQDRMDLTKH